MGLGDRRTVVVTSTDWTIFQYELTQHCDPGSVGAYLLYMTARIPVSPSSTARSLKRSDQLQHYSKSECHRLTVTSMMSTHVLMEFYAFRSLYSNLTLHRAHIRVARMVGLTRYHARRLKFASNFA
jgi:hypothetical protein